MTRGRPALNQLALASVLLVSASCSSSTDIASSTVPSLDSTTTTPPTTTVAAASSTSIPPDATVAATTTETPSTTTPPTTTVAAATTVPPTTPPPLVVTDLVLRADAIGPLNFGEAPDGVVARLSGVLGAPTSDDITTYPTDEGGYWSNEATEGGFAAPHGRDVCWTNGLCVYFGGDTSGALTFVGWMQDEATGQLATRTGITVGSRGSSHAGEMTVFEGGCFSTGGGDADGVDLFLISDGVPFLEFVGDTYVTHVPDLSEVTVLQLSAGEQPFFLFEDC